MHSIPTTRPESAPGQWWHLFGDAEVDGQSLKVLLAFGKRCRRDRRDHVNATYYIDALTNAAHLLASMRVLPRGLLYTELESKYLVLVPPDATVRMLVNFTTEGHRWRFTAAFSVDGKDVASINGVAAVRPAAR